jgi:hypothetical protein
MGTGIATSGRQVVPQTEGMRRSLLERMGQYGGAWILATGLVIDQPQTRVKVAVATGPSCKEHTACAAEADPVPLSSSSVLLVQLKPILVPLSLNLQVFHCLALHWPAKSVSQASSSNSSPCMCTAVTLIIPAQHCLALVYKAVPQASSSSLSTLDVHITHTSCSAAAAAAAAAAAVDAILRRPSPAVPSPCLQVNAPSIQQQPESPG